MIPNVQAPTKPVLLKADGAGGCALCFVAVVWNAMAMPILFVPHGKSMEWPAYFVVSIFLLIDFILLWKVAQTALSTIRHKRPLLRLDGHSWETGRLVRVSMLTHTPHRTSDRIEAKLVVIQTIIVKTGKRHRAQQKILWSVDLAINTHTEIHNSHVTAHSVELPLPSNLPLPTQDVTWRLEWLVDRSGPDLNATFTLPIIACGDGSELLVQDIERKADLAAPLAVLFKDGIRINEERGEAVITLPAWRHPELPLSGIIASTLFSAGAIVLWQCVSKWTGLLTVPILLLCWRGAMRSALWHATIVLSKEHIAVTAGWWRSKHKKLSLIEVIAIERESSMSSENVAWFNMWIKTKAGERIPLARAVRGPAALRITEIIDAARKI